MTCTCSSCLLSQSLFQLCLPATHPLERGRNRNPAPTPTIIYVYTNNFQEQNYLRALGRNHQKETQTQKQDFNQKLLASRRIRLWENLTGRVWTPSDWISGNCLWNCIFQTCFFFPLHYRRMTTVWENPFAAGFGLSTWLPFRKKLHGLLESLTALGRKFWLEKLDYIYFWKRARLPKKLWREDPESNHRFQKKKPCLRKSTAAFRKIGHYLCQNPLLLLVKSAAVFGTKQPPLWGRWAGSGFSSASSSAK